MGEAGETCETGEEFDFLTKHSYHDLFNNSSLTGLAGLTGLVDHTAAR
jgi:hypothetical protein